jgi:hypothetical protein
VLLSSLSVEYAEPDASSRAHLASEAAVLAARMSHTFLRPGAFMGNDLIWVPEIQSFGTVSAAYPEAAQAPVDERDIAAVSRSHAGPARRAVHRTSAQVELRDRVRGVRVRFDRKSADHRIAVRRLVGHFVVEMRHENPQFPGARTQVLGQLADLDHQDLLSRLHCRGTACSLSGSG